MKVLKVETNWIFVLVALMFSDAGEEGTYEWKIWRFCVFTLQTHPFTLVSRLSNTEFRLVQVCTRQLLFCFKTVVVFKKNTYLIICYPPFLCEGSACKMLNNRDV